MPVMNSSGMNTAMSEKLSEMTVNPICFDAFERGLHRRFARLDVAHDVFDHHDGVVHHETRRDRQRHERKIVEAEADRAS